MASTVAVPSVVSDASSVAPVAGGVAAPVSPAVATPVGGVAAPPQQLAPQQLAPQQLAPQQQLVPPPQAVGVPGLPPPNNTGSLYVGDLAPDVNESTLYDTFISVGPVASTRLCRDNITRRSLGYGYVNFMRAEDAERAIDTLNFKEINGRQCRIMWSHRDPTLRRTGKGNICVKNLAKFIDNKTLFDTFSMFGEILSCKVAFDANHESLGYGFVHFASEESALKAIERTNGKVIGDSIVQVQEFKSRSERQRTTPQRFNNLYVKHFPSTYNAEALTALFAPFGTVTSCVVPAKEDGTAKGFGYVCFASTEEAVAAIAGLNEKPMEDGRKLFVSRHQKKDERLKENRDRKDRERAERQRKFAGCNLYVKNLMPEMTEERLKQLFAEFGNIMSARIMRDATGASRLFGFVCFSASEEATKAVTSLNGSLVDGKPLYVALAQDKTARSQQLEAMRFSHMQQQQQQFAHMQQLPPGTPMPYPPMGAIMYPNMMPQQRFAPPFPQQMPFMQGLPQGGPQRWPAAPGLPMNVPRGMNFAAMQGGAPGPRGIPMSMQMPMQMPMQMMGAPGGVHPRGPPHGGNRKGHRTAGGPGPMPPMGAPVAGVPGPMPGQPQPVVVAMQQQQQQQQQQQLPQQVPVPQQVVGGPKPVLAGVPQPQQMLYAEVVRAEPPVQAAHLAQPPVVAAIPEAAALTAADLAAAPENTRKQMIGERLYPRVSAMVSPDLAGKITGMLIEMDVAETLHLLESPAALTAKIEEALAVLQQHNTQA